MPNSYRHTVSNYYDISKFRTEKRTLLIECGHLQSAAIQPIFGKKEMSLHIARPCLNFPSTDPVIAVEENNTVPENSNESFNSA
jgi:hypothetical protein